MFSQTLGFHATRDQVPAKPFDRSCNNYVAWYEQTRLKGKNITLIFEISSTRTPTSFEVIAYYPGANVTYLGLSRSHIRHKETMRDTPRVQERIYDGIGYPGFAHATIETLAEYACEPGWNGLTWIIH